MSEESPEKPEEYAVGSCLEILALWCLPSVVVPLIIGFTAAAWPVGVVVSIFFLIWMGTSQRSTGSQGGERKASAGRVALYVVAQMIIIPIAAGAVAFAVCSAALH